MRIPAVQQLDVDVEPGVGHECFPEFLDQLGIEGPDALAAHSYFVDQVRTPREVDSDPDQSLVHGKVRMSKADNAFLVAESLIQRESQTDPHILDGVMRIDLEISLARDIQIENAMFGKQREHVVEKRNSSSSGSVSAAVEIERKLDVRLARSSCDGCLPLCHGEDSSGSRIGRRGPVQTH